MAKPIDRNTRALLERLAHHTRLAIARGGDYRRLYVAAAAGQAKDMIFDIVVANVGAVAASEIAEATSQWNDWLDEAGVDCERCARSVDAHTCIPRRPRAVVAVKLQAKWRADAYAVVHRSSDDGQAAWRVSWFDAEGAVGHTCRNTPEEALSSAVADGYAIVLDVRHEVAA